MHNPNNKECKNFPYTCFCPEKPEQEKANMVQQMFAEMMKSESRSDMFQVVSDRLPDTIETAIKEERERIAGEVEKMFAEAEEREDRLFASDVLSIINTPQ